MKKIYSLLFTASLLVSCQTTNLPSSVPPTQEKAVIPTAPTETSLIPTNTPLPSNTSEPMMFKVAEFGRGYIFDHALSPDGKTMAIASSSGLYLYDTNTQEIICQGS